MEEIHSITAVHGRVIQVHTWAIILYNSVLIKLIIKGIFEHEPEYILAVVKKV